MARETEDAERCSGKGIDIKWEITSAVRRREGELPPGKAGVRRVCQLYKI